MTASHHSLSQQTGHDNQLTAINPTSGDAAAQHVQDHSVTIQVAPAKTGTSWVFVFDRLLSEIKIRHYSPKTLKLIEGGRGCFKVLPKVKITTCYRSRTWSIF